MSNLAEAATTNSTIYVHDTHAEVVLLSINDVLTSINEKLSGGTGTSLSSSAQSANVTLPSYAEFLDGFSSTVESFGVYVKQLSEINIPSEIKMTGNHVVDVRITGAAAFEGLKKDFQVMMKQEISTAMNKIWQQSGGKLGMSDSAFVKSAQLTD